MRICVRKTTDWPSRLQAWTTDTLENLKDGVYPIRNRVLDHDFRFDFAADRRCI
jgi:hypothetical protein